MCGIFAFLNYASPNTAKIILENLLMGLRKLEYRGYDSAGLALEWCGSPLVFRQTGNVSCLEKSIFGGVVPEKVLEEVFFNHVGIAHTRWATHGGITHANTHPQTSSPKNEFLVVHNGIITNYTTIKLELEKRGFEFDSQTDTEVIAKLALYFYETERKENVGRISFASIIRRVSKVLNGAYAFACISTFFPHEMCIIKRGSPLILGFKHLQDSNIPIMFSDEEEILPERIKNELFVDPSAKPITSPLPCVEYIVASDVNAVLPFTKSVLYLEEDDLVHFSSNGLFKLHRPETRSQYQNHQRAPTTLEMELSEISKGKFDTYMRKEIFEQPESLSNTMRGRVNFDNFTIHLGGLRDLVDIIVRSRKFIMIACGSSYHSALATRGFFEEMTGIPVVVELSSDFMDRKTPTFRDDTCIFISQSGETADTLSALHHCKKSGSLCIGIVNTVASAIARQTDCGIYISYS
uniref:glutamine--fructose-6-phosphate transaminase (isomerizing) n=1 Tax=Arcella intermedia TaxID=1963864 RepID=A0A6B2L386_9EUKA